jgi:hypothetical protein
MQSPSHQFPARCGVVIQKAWCCIPDSVTEEPEARGGKKISLETSSFMRSDEVLFIRFKSSKRIEQ